MKLRTLVVTIAVLAVLSAIVALVQNRPTSTAADPKVGQPLVERATAEKAAKLRLSDQGKTVTLVRQSDGSWRDASYFDLPADFQKLSRFVSDLTDAKLQRLVTSNPERIARLEFKDTKIDLLDSADKELWSVTLGKNADAGGRFVRYGSEAKAYLSNLNAWIDAEPKNWAEAQLLSVKPDEIARIELTVPATTGGAPETIVVSRPKKDQPWTADKTPANQQLKADRIASVATSLTGLRFTETTELSDAKVTEAKQHQRTYKLTTFEGKNYTIAIGRKPEEKKLKPPSAAPTDKSGPGALGSLADLAKAKEPEKTGAEAGKSPAPEPKPLAPEFETVPAGPAFAVIRSSDANAPINAAMQKRAFEVPEYSISQLPQTANELFEAVPPPPTPAPAAATPANADEKTAPKPAAATPAK